MTEVVEAFGASSGNFLLSPTLTTQNAQLINIENMVATILIPDVGVIKANLTAINAKLVSLEGNVAIIQSDIGTLKTDAETINARVASIEGNTITISSDLGTIKSEVTPAGFEIGAITLILSLIAAIGAALSATFIQKMKPTTSK